MISHALTWAEAHPLVVLVVLWLLVSLAVAVTPERYRRTGWYAWLVRVADRLSVLTHSDSPGTLKLPGVASAIDPRGPVVLEQVERAAGKRGFASLSSLALIVVVACAAVLLHGCAMSPIARQAVAISVVADTTSGGAMAIDHAARADLHASCPTLAPECVTAVRARWAPADAAVASVVAALGLWRDALDISRQAGTAPGPTVLRALQSLARAYVAMREALAPLHVEVPPLPPEAIGALGAVGGTP